MRWHAIAVALATVSCATPTCKPGTLFVTFRLTNGAEAADSLDIALSIDGAPDQTESVRRKSSSPSGSIEIDFGRYPKGQSISLRLTARSGNQILASAFEDATLTAGCERLSFVLDASLEDLGAAVADAASEDAAVADQALASDLAPDALGPDLACRPAACPATACGTVVDSCVGSIDCGPCSVGAFESTAVTLAVPRVGHTATRTEHFVYVVGGSPRFSDVSIASVERAPILADGSLGSFSLVSSALNNARWGHIAVATDRYLYVIDGQNNASPPPVINSVERAPINPDESLGPFELVPGVALTQPRKGMAGVRIGSDFYVAGGNIYQSGYVPVANVDVATVQPDGTLSNFRDSGRLLEIAREHHGAVTLGGSLFVVGGWAPGSGTNMFMSEQSNFTDVDGGVALGSFADAGVTVAQHMGGSIIGMGVNLYAIGGSVQPGVSRVIEKAVLTSGQLGKFQADMGLLTSPGRGLAATVLTGSYLYLLGGCDGSGSCMATNTVERAPLLR